MSKLDQLFTMVTAPWMSFTIYAGLKLGLIDRIAERPATGAELAEAAGIEPSPTQRLLEALTKLGVLQQSPNGEFALSEMGRPLADPEGEMRSWSMLWCEEFSRAWAALPTAMLTRQCAFDVAHGLDIFGYLGSAPNSARIFNQAMAGLSRRLYAAVPHSFEFEKHQQVVDVGGGTGALLASILRAHAHLRGCLLEQGNVIEQAKAVLGAAGVAERCDVREGNFFASVPAGADIYILSNVIHDWDDARAEQILGCCRRAIAPGGKLLLLEMALGAAEPALARMTDMNMLVLTGGRERTHDDFHRLCQRSGFRMISVSPLADSICLIHAEAA